MCATFEDPDCRVAKIWWKFTLVAAVHRCFETSDVALAPVSLSNGRQLVGNGPMGEHVPGVPVIPKRDIVHDCAVVSEYTKLTDQQCPGNRLQTSKQKSSTGAESGRYLQMGAISVLTPNFSIRLRHPFGRSPFFSTSPRNAASGSKRSVISIMQSNSAAQTPIMRVYRASYVCEQETGEKARGRIIPVEATVGRQQQLLPRPLLLRPGSS